MPLPSENLILQCESPSSCGTCAYRAQPQLSAVLTVLLGFADASRSPGSWALVFCVCSTGNFSPKLSLVVTALLSTPFREAGVIPLPPPQVLFLNLRFADFFHFYQRKRKDQILSKGIFPMSDTFKLCLGQTLLDFSLVERNFFSILPVSGIAASPTLVLWCGDWIPGLRHVRPVLCH